MDDYDIYFKTPQEKQERYQAIVKKYIDTFNKESNLLRCPFCNDKPKFIIDASGGKEIDTYLIIFCPTCLIKFEESIYIDFQNKNNNEDDSKPGSIYNVKNILVDTWNKRK